MNDFIGERGRRGKKLPRGFQRVDELTAVVEKKTGDLPQES
jgi:hypothetical protein